ncbi:MAG: BamA/TamA family outer membrane protein [Prevotellaceae bacterium]|jgi:outer membrane protein assembly factor BamA|nr:BamA/TamA family outer membrane protein [Prevotellaceae bacterium]
MRQFLAACALCLLAACSTTRHLPEGEVLYTGQKKLQVSGAAATPLAQTALEEITAALAKKPNNSFLGSSSMRTPFPIGLWFYGGFKRYEHQRGLGHWIFNHFAAPPVLISGVNPAIRAKVATNILHDYGFFNGTVGYTVVPHRRDSLKAKIAYAVTMGRPYTVDTLFYRGFTPQTLRLLEQGRRRSLVARGEQFNVVKLDEERTRLSTLLRNMGYYYFRPDYLTYQADTTLQEGGYVSLRAVPVPGIPRDAERMFFTGKTRFFLLGKQGEQPNDSLTYRGLEIYYHNKLLVRPKMLYRWLNYQGYRRKRQALARDGARVRPEKLYSQYRQSRIQERLTSTGVFSYLEMQYQPRDPALLSDTLDVNIRARLDKAYDAELDFNMRIKSNNQMGPGATFTVTRNNVFGGGETWNIRLNGSYEWQTGRGSSSAMNSYEAGVSSSLTFPRVLFPRLGSREYDFPSTTTFGVNLNQLSRARYYKLLSFGGSASYEFTPVPTKKHTLIPFRLTFNVLRDPTAEFLQIEAENPALYISLRDQFIPAAEYTFTFDGGKARGVKRPVWWQTTLASAGNVTSLIYRLAGDRFSEQNKKLWGVPFAQFLKVNSELRYDVPLAKNQKLAARVAAGVVWAYGNSTGAPYTEMFYVGGANSVRAFTSRSIGPGGTVPEESKYAFIDQVGDVRFEANVEYRFKILGDLHGALFIDAGNVWMLRRNEARPLADLRIGRFLDQLALGTGAGVRYDMDFLVFRLDCGLALHAPYDTGRKSYYNIAKFGDGLALHFAIGYPF